MIVFRIVLSRYAGLLTASGNAARWNSKGIKVIYASGSRSLCCLENIVHRSKLGLSANFSVLTIEINDKIAVERLTLKDLPQNWMAFENLHITQNIGDKWIAGGKTAVLQVPSSIIGEEYNFLINPDHSDFRYIKWVNAIPFLFDERIKN